ncbi:MAG: phospholipase domain-containing protein, partial [Phenylobacterium sp.]
FNQRCVEIEKETAAAVFHVYDLTDLTPPPRRYTVGPGKTLEGAWPAGAHDLWVLGPGGFHRHCRGAGEPGPTVAAAYDRRGGQLILSVHNPSAASVEIVATANAYELKPWGVRLAPGATAARAWALAETGGWYDLSLATPADPQWLRRLAGRLETGRPSITDPAMGGPALMVRT